MIGYKMMEAKQESRIEVMAFLAPHHFAFIGLSTSFIILYIMILFFRL